MKKVLAVVSGFATAGAVAWWLSSHDRPRPAAAPSETESAQVTADEPGTAAPSPSRITTARVTHDTSPAAAPPPVLLGPAPFDPTPIQSAPPPRNPPPAADIPPVRESPHASAFRNAAVASPSADARVEAIMKLAEIGGPSDVAALNQLIANDPDLRVREAAHHAVLVIHSRFSGQPWK